MCSGNPTKAIIISSREYLVTVLDSCHYNTQQMQEILEYRTGTPHLFKRSLVTKDGIDSVSCIINVLRDNIACKISINSDILFDTVLVRLVQRL